MNAMSRNQEELKPKQYKTGGWSAHYILIICTLLYIINYADRQVFSAVLQPMKLELSLTDAQCGMAQTLFLLGMALFSFPVAYLVDRWSRKGAIAVMAVVWSGLTYITGLATSFVGMLIPRSMVGVGESGFVAGGTAIIGAAYPKELRSRVLGIFSVATPLGAALGVMLGGMISTQYGWRMPFLVFAIPGIILGVLALFMKDYRTAAVSAVQGEKTGFGNAILKVISIPTLRWAYAAFGIFCFMSISVMVWLPAFIIRTLNVSEGQAGLLVGGIGLMAIIGAPLSGLFADFWQKRNNRGRLYFAALTAAVTTVLLIVMVLLKFNTVGIAIGILYGIFSIMSQPVLMSVSQDVVPAAHKGFSMGIGLFCTYVFGGAWGPLAIGGISDAFGGGAGGLGTALTISGGAGILSAIMFLFAARHYAPDMARVEHETLLAQ